MRCSNHDDNVARVFVILTTTTRDISDASLTANANNWPKMGTPSLGPKISSISLLRGYSSVTFLHCHLLRGNPRFSSISSFAWNSSRFLLLRVKASISSISSYKRNSSFSWSPLPLTLRPAWEHTSLFFEFFVCVEFFADFFSGVEKHAFLRFRHLIGILRFLPIPLPSALRPTWEHTA